MKHIDTMKSKSLYSQPRTFSYPSAESLMETMPIVSHELKTKNGEEAEIESKENGFSGLDSGENAWDETTTTYSAWDE